ncbi:FkbM family methyltransferase, partial [bacterium]|nr:FkbM family methyltransferase [bacterium]
PQNKVSVKKDTHLIIHTIYGFDVLVYPNKDHGLEKELYYRGTYEAGTLHVIQNTLRKGDTFLDIGANIGLMSLLAATMVKKDGAVHSFEPEPDVFSSLSKNTQLNNFTQITINSFGLGAYEEEKTLYLHPEISRGSSSLTNENVTADTRQVTVSIKRLDDYIAANSISTVRMIKIDVEGWEADVLKGAENLLKQPDAPILCVENGEYGNGETIYDHILKLNSYRAFKLRKTKDWISGLVEIQKFSDVPKNDNLFFFLSDHLTSVPGDLFHR